MVRASSVVSFVAGLLLCVPLIPQGVGICAAVVALARRRLPKERVGLAWAGLLLSLAGMTVWMIVLVTLPGRTGTVGPVAPPLAGPTTPPPDTWEHTSELIGQMNRVHQAANTYYRDYKRWPDGIEPMVGRSLPPSFKVSSRLTYRPVPPTEQLSMDRVLMVSDTVSFDEDGQPLDGPHRLILRLSGKVEALPEQQVQDLLNTQSANPPPE
jgi:hypothetical protein